MVRVFPNNYSDNKAGMTSLDLYQFSIVISITVDYVHIVKNTSTGFYWSFIEDDIFTTLLLFLIIP